MSKEVKMKKDTRSKCGTTMEAKLSNGKLSMLTKLRRNKPRDWLKTSDSMPTDHSTSDQECHSRELWQCTAMPICISKDGRPTTTHKCSGLIQSARPSEIRTGRDMPLQSHQMETPEDT
jgi:hypothetical protein